MNRDIQLKLLQALLEEITNRYDQFIQLQKETIQKTYEMAVKDRLTGLYNRMYFEDYMIHLIKKSRRDGSLFQLLFIDLDNFKPINDLYGHAEGDKVLREVAGFLREHFRDYDILSRFGGDEFCVILEDGFAKERIEKVRQDFEESFDKYNLSFSYGLVSSREVELNKDPKEVLKELLEVVDSRMYSQKARIKLWKFSHQPS